MYHVTALGELLIDFIQDTDKAHKNPVFEANPGGAPCNVLAMLGRLGFSTAFIGKVGNDYLGRMLERMLEKNHISRQGLIYDKKVNTTLALVHTLPDGDRDFSFYRKPGADIMLRSDEISWKLIDACSIFHFGSLSLTDEPAAFATKKAVSYAKSAGKLISFDPNLRPPLWSDLILAKDAIWYGIRMCDILKIADNEIKWLTGTEDYDKGVEIILNNSNIKMLNITLGKEGSLSYYDDKKVFGIPYLNKDITDTTGAGDTFCACVLGYILEHGITGLQEDNLKEMLQFSNAAASIVTTRKGAMQSMPEKDEIYRLMSRLPRLQ